MVFFGFPLLRRRASPRLRSAHFCLGQRLRKTLGPFFNLETLATGRSTPKLKFFKNTLLVTLLVALFHNCHCFLRFLSFACTFVCRRHGGRSRFMIFFLYSIAQFSLAFFVGCVLVCCFDVSFFVFTFCLWWLSLSQIRNCLVKSLDPC